MASRYWRFASRYWRIAGVAFATAFGEADRSEGDTIRNIASPHRSRAQSQHARAGARHHDPGGECGGGEGRPRAGPSGGGPETGRTRSACLPTSCGLSSGRAPRCAMSTCSPSRLAPVPSPACASASPPSRGARSPRAGGWSGCRRWRPSRWRYPRPGASGRTGASASGWMPSGKKCSRRSTW